LVELANAGFVSGLGGGRGRAPAAAARRCGVGDRSGGV
jgi:hypothetical protein